MVDDSRVTAVVYLRIYREGQTRSLSGRSFSIEGNQIESHTAIAGLE